MNHDIRPLLVELFTEELPPKALQALGAAFADGIRAALAKANLLADGCQSTPFATPRRLAVHFSRVRAQAPEQAYADRLMPVKVGLNEDGSATPALTKKLAAKGWSDLDVATLARESDGKQDYLVARGSAPGATLALGLQTALDAAIAGLPIPKVMRYQLADGQTTVRFVRPAHGLTALFGADVVPVAALGLTAGRTVHGHRFLCAAPIELAHADEYEARLHDEGHVSASFEKRRDDIAAQLAEQAARLHASIGEGAEVDALLDEVTALVELPAVYVGEFDPAFLAVPPECLILTMRLNQKYFPLFDPDTNALTHRFLIVSNMRVADPTHIIEGNQRVVRPRLADAQFFFDTDRKQPLHTRIPALAHAVYHNKLGSQLARSQRIERIARFLAERLDADEQLAARAAQLLKADLTTEMVGEFPELQGIMGAHYAQINGENGLVVQALREQYRIRLDDAWPGFFNLGILPTDRPNNAYIPAIVFVAERAETLIGIWGIGLAPTGERDPYALRRAAIGLISALEFLGALVPLSALLHTAQQTFEAGVLAEGTVEAVHHFIYERCRHQHYATYDKTIVDAVMTVTPPLFEVRPRIQACSEFLKMPEAASLIAANKRINNLLKKTDAAIGVIDTALFAEPAEHVLAQAIKALTPVVQAEPVQGSFTANLTALAGVKQAVDDFFEYVMVMTDDPVVRANRLALLHSLHGLMNRVADISRLAA